MTRVGVRPSGGEKLARRDWVHEAFEVVRLLGSAGVWWMTSVGRRFVQQAE